MNNTIKFIAVAIAGVSLLAGCSSEDKAALEAAKANAIAQKTRRDAAQKKFRDMVKDFNKHSYMFVSYCNQDEKQGFVFDPKDVTDKYCLDNREALREEWRTKQY